MRRIIRRRIRRRIRKREQVYSNSNVKHEIQFNQKCGFASEYQAYLIRGGKSVLPQQKGGGCLELRVKEATSSCSSE